MEAVGAQRWVAKVGAPSMLVVLATGIYAVGSGWGWAGWVQAAMLGLISLAVIGGVLSRFPARRAVSLATRMAVTAGIVFLMIGKPERGLSFAILAGAAMLGAAAGFAISALRS